MQPRLPIKNRGAFLVIALILLVVLSALVVAAMNLSINSFRVSRNYSNHIDADAKALSMAGYAQRILDTYTGGQYPLPLTCNSSGTCNVINNNFPFSGRPTFVWSANLDTENLIKTGGSNSWWTTNGFGYEGTFAGSGNARAIVSLVGQQSNLPWTHTYEIVGYATDMQGQARATSMPLYYSINGYRPDPYPVSSGTNGYTTSACTGGCPYGQCCNQTTTLCGVTQADCEGNRAYQPDGWFCDDYFMTALGLTGTCTALVSKVFNAMTIFEDAARQSLAEFVQTGSFAPTVTINGTTINSGTPVSLNYKEITTFSYNRSQATVGALMYARIDVTGTERTITYAFRSNGDGTVSYACGNYSLSQFPTNQIFPGTMPAECDCTEVNTWYTTGAGCTGH